MLGAVMGLPTPPSFKITFYGINDKDPIRECNILSELWI